MYEAGLSITRTPALDSPHLCSGAGVLLAPHALRQRPASLTTTRHPTPVRLPTFVSIGSSASRPASARALSLRQISLPPLSTAMAPLSTPSQFSRPDHVPAAGVRVHWYYGDTATRQGFINGGYLEEGKPEVQGADGTATLIVKLRSDLTWDDVNAVSGWCEPVRTRCRVPCPISRTPLPRLLTRFVGRSAQAHIPSLSPHCVIQFQADFGSLTLGPGPAMEAPACTSNHPFVGRQATFSSFQHQWAGTVTVLDDCSFKVEDFTYDGTAPQAFFWASADTARSSIRNGFPLHDTPLSGATNALVVKMLPEGKTWDDVPVLSGWCVTFSALFGLVDLRTAQVRPLQAALTPARICVACTMPTFHEAGFP